MNNRKKLAVILAACLLTVGAAGCANEKTDENSQFAADTNFTDSADQPETEAPDESEAPEEPEAAVGIPNPMKDVTAGQLAEETGIALTAPEGSTDVRYFTIESGSALTAQMNFTYNGRDYSYRAMPTAELTAVDTTGLYYTWTETKEIAVGGCTAVLNLGSEAAGLYWLDIAPGINYSLSCSGAASEEEMADTAALLFAPVQGNAEGDVNYNGMFLNGSAEAGCDFVTTNQKNDGTYDVQVSIYRLSTFSGTGSITDGALEMSLTDPNKDELNAIFYPEDDGTFSLKITVSNWSLLEEGTVFTGFTVSE